MEAAFVYGPRDLRVEGADVPRIGDDEVLVRVRAQAALGRGRNASRIENSLNMLRRHGYDRFHP